jgi:hypothetical protein
MTMSATASKGRSTHGHYVLLSAVWMCVADVCVEMCGCWAGERKRIADIIPASEGKGPCNNAGHATRARVGEEEVEVHHQAPL